ncbi:hypothetical protein [Clostridium felsineum]|uniref:Uncharacterized protein n=1 Tax=Clostridium felsineum TaxID=36839 RepID=A0A1S8LD84_9CLOT|nr:hypothetical protein [Clostridium felsineum]URZ05926.1 hypothetical protein CLROS_012580 [Clostridium felsineum]URZ10963.1 hypothetical protein CROST_016790 [Clostridium felsineum]
MELCSDKIDTSIDIDEIVYDKTNKGCFTEPDTTVPKFNLRGLIEYSKKKGVKPNQLTEKERNKFLIK